MLIEVHIVMSGRYSGKFSQRQCKVQLSRENLGGKWRVHFSGFS